MRKAYMYVVSSVPPCVAQRLGFFLFLRCFFMQRDASGGRGEEERSRSGDVCALRFTSSESDVGSRGGGLSVDAELLYAPPCRHYVLSLCGQLQYVLWPFKSGTVPRTEGNCTIGRVANVAVVFCSPTSTAPTGITASTAAAIFAFNDSVVNVGRCRARGSLLWVSVAVEMPSGPPREVRGSI